MLRYFGTDLAVRMKEPGQPLTVADLEADALLKEMLGHARPEYGWLSEETEDSPDRLSRSRVWIVDPIDGTRSFVAGRPEFSVSVGLAIDGVAVVGVVFNPARDELFCAVRGAGAFAEVGGARETLRVAERTAADGVGMIASRSEIAAGALRSVANGWRVEGVGSTAYKLARVAWGRGDVFYSGGSKKEWDVCAGVVLVEEAGGRVTSASGDDFTFNRAEPVVRGVAAASADLHAVVLHRVATSRGEESAG